MSTVEERLLDRVRMELGDLESPFDFAFAADGVRDHYNLEHRPIKVGSVTVNRDGLIVTDLPGAGVTIDHQVGIMVFATPPPVGEVWEITAHKYRYFSDDDLNVFIGSAMKEHFFDRADYSGGDFTTGDLPPVEEYPIALLGTIQALWALATDASFDIDILAPDGVNIPRSERFAQLMELIGARKRQYDEIAAALNVGLNRIESYTVRRTAKLTNRLVPVFLPQEYDDASRQKRVVYPPNLLGTPPVQTGIATYDWNIISGEPVGVTFDFEFDLTGCVVENAIRRMPMGGGYPGNVIGPPVQTFTQTVIDAPNGQIRFSLDGPQTRTLPYNCYWECQVKRPGETESRTKLRGLIRATNNEIVRDNPSAEPVA